MWIRKTRQISEHRLVRENLIHFKIGTKIYNLSNFPIQLNCSLEHELKKIEEGIKLIRDGRTIAFNPILKGFKFKGIPDIVVLDLPSPMVYEIMNSEEYESIELKKSKYPFRIIPIKI